MNRKHLGKPFKAIICIYYSMKTPAQKAAQKRWVEKNRERMREINRNSMKKRYQEDEQIREQKSIYYYSTRNKIGDNYTRQLNELFEDEEHLE